MGQELLVQEEEALGERVSPLSQEPLPSPRVGTPQQGQGVNRKNKQYQCWQCEEVGGASEEGLPYFKRKRAVSRG